MSERIKEMSAKWEEAQNFLFWKKSLQQNMDEESKIKQK